jgi:DNA-binding response OmpR family regulator
VTGDRVRTHLSSLYSEQEKFVILDAKDPRIIVTVHGVGYRFDG